jgi:hypothetical protein
MRVIVSFQVMSWSTSREQARDLLPTARFQSDGGAADAARRRREEMDGKAHANHPFTDIDSKASDDWFQGLSV